MAMADIRSEFLISDLIPVIFGVVFSFILFRFWVPFALKRVQIAFYTDDGIYEVHRITDTYEESRKLLGEDGAIFGVLLYRMAVTGLMILAGEIAFEPEVYSLHVLVLIMILLAVPVLISPVSSLIGQFTKTLSSRKADLIDYKKNRRVLVIVVSIVLVVLSLGFWLYLTRTLELTPEEARAWTLVLFLFPSVLVYGRVMGSSWNGLVQQKWKRAKGQASALNPHPPGFLARFLALFILVNIMLMPITALNGISSYIYDQFLIQLFPDDLFSHSERVRLVYPEVTSMSLSQKGGFIGFLSIELFSQVPDMVVAKFLSQLTVLFLILNVTLIGLAFVYEMVRMQFIGLGTIGGIGGVVIADGRALRAESSHRGLLVSFCFSAFTGYTVLMLVMAIFGRFPGVLPNAEVCTANLNTIVGNFSPEIRGTSLHAEACGVLSMPVVTQITYAINAAGQALFLPFWLISLPKWFRMKKANFDLSAIEDRGGPMIIEDKKEMAKLLSRTKPGEDALSLLKSDRLGDLVGVLKRLDRSDASRDRELHARTEMLFAASRGDWKRAEDYAVNLLAQKEGEDLMSRKLLAAAALANRDLLEAKIRLDDLPENEPEADQLRWVASLFALKGKLRKFEVDEMLQLTPGGRRLEDLVSRFPMLMAWPSKKPRIDNSVDRRGLLGDVARLRLSGRSDDALEKIKEIQTMMPDMLGARWYVAEALCLIDLGRKKEAMEIYRELSKSEYEDPYVGGLCEVLRSLGEKASFLSDRTMDGEIEVLIATDSKKMSRLQWSRIIDSMPTNAVAALKLGRKGQDEALASNAWISMGPAIKKNIWPVVRGGYVVSNALFICMILAGLLVVYMEGALGIPLIIGAGGLWARSGNLRQVVRHRDMPLCRDYASRLRAKRAMIKYEDLPVGIHLMLSGIVVPIDNVPIDLGYPLWVDPIARKTDRLLPGLNLGKGSDKKRKKKLELHLDGESKGIEGRGMVSKSSVLSMIDKKNQQKRSRYDGIRNFSSSVVQARDGGVSFGDQKYDERNSVVQRRPSSRRLSKRSSPPGFRGTSRHTDRDSIFY
tara:strand:- start:3263 stop:6439 length:3177 start_codon:yes stop_codon:yes gene_type:complete